MSTETGTEVRDRLWLPFAIPMGAVGLTAVVVFLFSRVLLNVPPSVAVAVALMMALNILVVCAVIALRPGMRSASAFLPVIAVAAVPLFLSAAIMTGFIESSDKASEGEHKAAAPAKTEAAAGASISAKNLKFDKSQLTLPVGEVTVEFDSQESLPHNFSVYTTPDASETVFKGDIFSGPAKKKFTFSLPKPGSYFFRCDLHPATMSGTITAA